MPIRPLIFAAGLACGWYVADLRGKADLRALEAAHAQAAARGAEKAASALRAASARAAEAETREAARLENEARRVAASLALEDLANADTSMGCGLPARRVERLRQR